MDKAKTILDKVLDFIDLILTQLKKGPKYLFDEFSKIVDEIFGAGKKVDELPRTKAEKRVLAKKEAREKRLIKDSDLDWMASRKEGNLGGNLLKKTQIRKLRGILKKKGIHLIEEGDLLSVKKLFKPVTVESFYFDNVDDLFYFMRNNDLVGGFDAVNKQFILPANSTEIVAFHEMAHVKHFEQLGEAYHELNVLQKETYVWKEILINRGKWTEKELKESLRYINVKRKESGLNPLKIE